MTAAGAIVPVASASATTVAPRIVVFDDLPADAVKRLRDAGISHAALFPDADAASILGSGAAYRRVKRFRDVAAMYPDGLPLEWPADTYEPQNLPPEFFDQVTAPANAGWRPQWPLSLGALDRLVAIAAGTADPAAAAEAVGHDNACDCRSCVALEDGISA